MRHGRRDWQAGGAIAGAMRRGTARVLPAFWQGQRLSGVAVADAAALARAADSGAAGLRRIALPAEPQARLAAIVALGRRSVPGLAVGAAAVLLLLPVAGLAQASGFVPAGEIGDIARVTLRPDGSAVLEFADGRTAVLPAEAVQVTASGEVLIALDALDAAVALAPAAAPGAGALAGGAGALGAAAAGGGGGAAAPLPGPEPEPEPVQGYVVDDYLAFATVFRDANGNGLLDAGELSTTTDATGAFDANALTAGSGRLVATGGHDIGTGLPFAGFMIAPEGTPLVTPLTTMVQALIESRANGPAPLDAVAAEAELRVALGLPGSLLATDPVAAAAAAEGADPEALILAARIQTVLTLAMAQEADANAVARALAEVVAQHGAGALDDAALLRGVIAAGLPAGADAFGVAELAAAANARLSGLSGTSAEVLEGVAGLQAAVSGALREAVTEGALPEGAAIDDMVDAAIGAARPLAPRFGPDGAINAAEAAEGPVIAGTGMPGSVVTVVFAGTARSATVAQDGTWQVTFAPEEVPQDGRAELEAQARIETPAGHMDSREVQGEVTVDRVAPDAPQVDPVGGDDLVTLAELAAGLVLTGAAEPGSRVALRFGGTELTVTAGADGRWQAAFAPGVAPDTGAAISVTATDAAGNESPAAEHPVTVQRRVTAAGTGEADPGPLLYATLLDPSVAGRVAGSVAEFAGARVTLDLSGEGLTFDSATALPVAGTVTTLIFREDGGQVLALTGLRLDAATLAQAVTAARAGDGAAFDRLLDLHAFDATLADSAGSFTGGPLGDSLTGGAGDDMLAGGAGADTIRGGDGDDVIHGGQMPDLPLAWSVTLAETLPGNSNMSIASFERGDGGYRFLWADTAADALMARDFDSAGRPLGDPVAVAEYLCSRSSFTLLDFPTGRLLIDKSATTGQWFDLHGNPVGDRVSFSDGSAGGIAQFPDGSAAIYNLGPERSVILLGPDGRIVSGEDPVETGFAVSVQKLDDGTYRLYANQQRGDGTSDRWLAYRDIGADGGVLSDWTLTDQPSLSYGLPGEDGAHLLYSNSFTDWAVQVVASDGTLVGLRSQFAVPAEEPLSMIKPLPSGGWLVGDVGSMFVDNGIVLHHISPDGTVSRRGTISVVDPDTSMWLFEGPVPVADGYVVSFKVWPIDGDPVGVRQYVQFLDETGAPRGEPFGGWQGDSSLNGNPWHQGAVFALPGGGFAVLTFANGGALELRRFDDLGTPLALGQDATGSDAADLLEGGAGNDTIHAGAGDTVDGGAGDDVVELVLHGAGPVAVLSGGEGADLLRLIIATEAAVEVDLAAGEVRMGGSLVARFDGFETVEPLAEGGGSVAMAGGPAAETLVLPATGTVLDAGAGDDSVIGGAAADVIDGGADNDTIDGGDGADTIYGGAGDDSIDGGSGTSNDSISGGDGNDYVRGRSGDDHIAGDAGTDSLVGEQGDDTLLGGTGNDHLTGGDGADLIDGGPGSDTANYGNSTAGVVIDLAQGIASGGQAEGDTLRGIENVTGSAHDDQLTGDDGRNVLTGGGGDDTLLGGDRFDQIYGGAGADSMDGGADTDWLRYNGTTVGVYVNLATGEARHGAAEGDVFANFENLYGSNGDDTLIGDDGPNFIAGHFGSDSLDGGGGEDFLYYGAGHSGIVADLTTGRVTGFDLVGADTLPFTDTIAGFENIQTDAGDDTLIGDDGPNRFRPADGDDVVFAGGGDDQIGASAGNDTLHGGDGNDGFEIRAGTGADVIDGGAGIDRLVAEGTGAGIEVVFTGDGAGWLASGDMSRYDDPDYAAIPEPGERLPAAGAAVDFTGLEVFVLGRWNDRFDASTDGLGVTVTGGGGDDTLIGGAGADRLEGDSGTWAYRLHEIAEGRVETFAEAGFRLGLDGIDPWDNENDLSESGLTSQLLPGTIDQGEYHAIAYTSTLTVGTAGSYLFNLSFTDGAMLFIDGEAVLGDDRGGNSYVGDMSQPIDLEARDYRLDVIFFQNEGGQALSLAMAGPDTGGAMLDLAGYAGLSAPGAAGADRLDGGAGDDTLTGGAGADVFVLSAGHDVITDFDFAEDMVDFGAVPVDLGEKKVEAIVIDGADAARLHLGEGQSLTFLGFDRTTFLGEVQAWNEA